MLPNFLVVGAGRSGTTSLHDYLAQHRQIFVSRDKSPNFFVSHEGQPARESKTVQSMARQWVSTREDYEALFAGARGERAVGEVSPVYLQALGAPARIHDVCPNARIVAVLRDPVERAYSHYMGRRRDGLDRRPTFAAAVDDELAHPLPDAVAFGSYLGCGRYHHFLRGYFDRFPRERIRIYLYDDLRTDARALVADLYAFLGADPSFEPDLRQRRGQTGVSTNAIGRFAWTRSAALRTALRPWLPRRFRDRAGRIAMGRLQRPPLDPVLRARLLPVFHEDIGRLQDLIGRDLSHWLER